VLVLRHGCALVFCHSEHFLCVIPNAVRNPVHGCFASLSMTRAVSFRTPVRNPVHGCFASLSMTRAEVSFRAFSLCHSERSEESTANEEFPLTSPCFGGAETSLSLQRRGMSAPADRVRCWMLRFVQNDSASARHRHNLFIYTRGSDYSLSLWRRHGKHLCPESGLRDLIALQCARVRYTLRCGRCAKDCLF